MGETARLSPISYAASKRVALAEGRQRDEQWLMDYAETCLGGPALSWFLELNDEALRSWKGLQRAMTQRFESVAHVAPPTAPAAWARPAAMVGGATHAVQTTLRSGPAPPLPSQVDEKAYGVCIVGSACQFPLSYEIFRSSISYSATQVKGIPFDGSCVLLRVMTELFI